jgi:SAM-dependent methyltransferase
VKLGFLESLSRSFRPVARTKGNGETTQTLCPCGGHTVPLEQFGKAVHLRWRKREAPARACSRCCHVSFEPPSEAELDDYYRTEYGAGSETYYTYDADHAKAAGRAKLAERLARDFHPDHPDPVILELGCAYGGPVAELRRRGRSAFGLDLNSRAIAEGRAKGNPFIFDVAPAQFPETTGHRADVIYSFHMLEHVRDLKVYLTALRPVLSDGGVAMFRVPNGAYLRAWLQGFASWDWFAFPDHLHMLSPASTACLVRDCGFELVGLTSNACAETLAEIASWLPEAAARGEAAVGLLEEAGCLRELEFVLRKTGGNPPADLGARKAAAAAFAARSAEAEAAIRASAGDFAKRVLG